MFFVCLINRLNNKLRGKKIGLVKALALCRIIDPINVEIKRRLNAMRDPVSTMTNDKTI